MVTFLFYKYGTILVTRELGSKVRKDLLSQIANNEMVVLDFKNVEIVGNAFADECLGKILLEMSLEDLQKHTTFKNLSGTSRVSVSAALRRRYNSLKKSERVISNSTR